MRYATEQNLTELALERWSDCKTERMRRIMTSLVRHLHGFVREVEPTTEEWLTACNWLARLGQTCDDKRQEFILLSDVLGVSMLVDAINNRFASGATPSTVQGPFHIEDSPQLEKGASMADGIEGMPCFITGTVRGVDGAPIAGAMLDIWQADGEGMYEAQLGVSEPRLRAIYRTGPDGRYAVKTITPIGYSIPMDGPVGELMKQTNISHYRPSHIHFLVEAPGYRRLVTHLFEKGARYIESDVVFGVKSELIADFKSQPAGRAPTGEVVSTPFRTVEYDFVLDRTADSLAASVRA
jgi:hydroxyquinol 1,2-dioxygenase